MILNVEQQVELAMLRTIAEKGVEACTLDWDGDNADLSGDEMAAVMISSGLEAGNNELNSAALLAMMTILTVMLVEERRKHA